MSLSLSGNPLTLILHGGSLPCPLGFAFRSPGCAMRYRKGFRSRAIMPVALPRTVDPEDTGTVLCNKFVSPRPSLSLDSPPQKLLEERLCEASLVCKSRRLIEPLFLLIFFSRYLSSQYYRVVHARTQAFISTTLHLDEANPVARLEKISTTMTGIKRSPTPWLQYLMQARLLPYLPISACREIIFGALGTHTVVRANRLARMKATGCEP